MPPGFPLPTASVLVPSTSFLALPCPIHSFSWQLAASFLLRPFTYVSRISPVSPTVCALSSGRRPLCSRLVDILIPSPAPPQSCTAAAAGAAGEAATISWAQDPTVGIGAGRLLGRRVVVTGRVVLLAREGGRAEAGDIAVVEWDIGGEAELPVGHLRFV